MDFSLEIQFRDIDESDFIYNDIWGHVEKLQRFYDRIISCHVIVSAPHRQHHQGKIYQIQIRLFIPGSDIFVTTGNENNHAHEDAYVAIRDAFDAARRKLEDTIRKERAVGRRELPSHGKITRIFPNEGCGFISTPEFREIYFHKHSVLNEAFEKLEVGDEVRFSEEMGEKGPQVTSMSKVGRSGHSHAWFL